MLLIGYIIVGGILLAWYKMIFYRELYQKNILRRSLKVLVNNIKIIIKNIFLFYEVDEKQQKELDYIKNKYQNYTISQDEMTYLAVHIRRIYIELHKLEESKQ